jgi:hypothetical protein
MSEFYQGYYNLVNREKYCGSNFPYYRSSWEKRFMVWCDENQKVLKWSSESVKIPYFFEGSVHTYFPDFYVEILEADGRVQKYILEVKPFNQGPTKTSDGVYVPKPPKNKNQKALKRYYYELKTYKKNESKWRAAKQFCEAVGYKFDVLTKEDLF